MRPQGEASRRGPGRRSARHSGGLLALCAALACEQAPDLQTTPRVVGVDLLDAQDLQGGRPARRRLFDGAAAQAVPESGPDLSLRLYLSVPLSMRSLSDAPVLGLLVRDTEGAAVGLRSFVAGPPDPPQDGAPAGAAQALGLTPDLRSSRSYVLSLDRSYLLDDRGVRLEAPPPLSFGTARRFVVLRADPPDGGQARLIDQVRLTMSSPIHPRPSEDYGVVLTAGGKQLEVRYQLSQNGRQLTVVPVCPLPAGQSTLLLPTGGVVEADTLAPLAADWSQTLTVTEDPGPCAEAPDMSADMSARDM